MKAKKASRAPRSSPHPVVFTPEVDRQPEKPAQEITDRQEEKSFYEITLRVPRVLIGRLEKAAFYALLAYAALLTLPVTVQPAGAGIDSSWATALNLLPRLRYKFGTDVIFTYGPLGFINWPQNVGANLIVATAARLLIWSLLIIELARSHRLAGRLWAGCLLAAASIILTHQFLLQYTDYLLATAALLLILRDSPEEQPGWVAASIAVLMSLAFLTKESGYVMLLLCLGAYSSVWYMRKRSRPSGGGWLRLAVIGGAPFLAYLVYNPSPRGMWAYITGASQIATGYSTAMSFAGLPGHERLHLSLLIVLLVGFAARAAWRSWLNIEVAACIVAAFCFVMKYSIVRPDAHLAFVYVFSIILAALLVLHCRPIEASFLTGGLAFIAICALSLSEINVVWSAFVPHDAASWSPVSNLRTLFRLRESIATAAGQSEANLRADKLSDSIRASIGRSSVVPFPNELSYAPANHLTLLPLYTLQAYAAYTHELDLRTAGHLLASPADTRLLMSWTQIDGRHVLLDGPATWEAIYSSFLPELAEPDLLLLKKREHQRIFHPKPLGSVIVDVRQWQEVPDRDHAVSAGIAFSQTILGSVRKLLYKIDPVYMELEPDIGPPQRFRVIPEVLLYPFVINCLPLSSTALQDILFENSCPQRVRRFRFLGEGLSSYAGTARVTFTETPDEQFRLAAREDAGPRESKIPSNMGEFWYGVLETVEGRPVPVANSAADPIRVTTRKRLEITGWAGYGNRTGGAFDAVYAVLGIWQFKGSAALRPDVVQFTGNPSFGRSGFNISVDTSTLDKGVYLLRLVGKSPDGKYYRCPGDIYVRIE